MRTLLEKPDKELFAIRGKGTAFEERIATGIMLSWCEAIGKYCTRAADLEDRP